MKAGLETAGWMVGEVPMRKRRAWGGGGRVTVCLDPERKYTRRLMLTWQGSVFPETLQLGVDPAPSLGNPDARVKGGWLGNSSNFHSQSRCV